MSTSMSNDPQTPSSTNTLPSEKPAARPSDESASFAETALKLGGKSDEEARRTGAIDKADDQVEALFAQKFQTTASPAHRAVWDSKVPVELFQSKQVTPPPAVAKVMKDSLDVVRRHRDAGTIYDEKRKVSETVLKELSSAGYWGLLVDTKYGGSGAPFAAFAPFLIQMASLDPTVAGMASVHGCIGAVDPVRTFGNEEQKARFLPELASGRRLSAFALTEPGAGSDLTALQTRAVRQGNEFIINGEKLFITNVVPGRTIGLVCMVENKPAVIIVDLPEKEDDHFRLKGYGLYALKHTYNQGIIFKDFRVPAENLLQPGRGDGLTIAYHGLNLGRVAVCATASGGMRLMLAGMLPWSKYRKTYGAAISSRELVRRRMGRLGALIVGADAMVHWCSNLIDDGYRGEMECIVAKIFGSESQKEAAIELYMKTHGGRSFLHGHMFGDNVHEYLAPCIYEGEGEMLGMAFFKSLVKNHGVKYFEPIGKTLAALGAKKPTSPAHFWALRGPMMEYGKWLMGRKFSSSGPSAMPSMPSALREHVEFASQWLGKSALEISATMRKYQLSLADRQCRMSELSLRVQNALTILCAALYAARQEDTLVRDAADVLCQDLTDKILYRRPSDRYIRSINRLGEAIADGGFQAIAGIPGGEILMPYDQG